MGRRRPGKRASRPRSQVCDVSLRVEPLRFACETLVWLRLYIDCGHNNRKVVLKLRKMSKLHSEARFAGSLGAASSAELKRTQACALQTDCRAHGMLYLEQRGIVSQPIIHGTVTGTDLERTTPMLIIDTHAHIYSPDEKRYPPIEKPLRPPGGKGSLEDLQRESLQTASKRSARSKPAPSTALTIATSATARAPIKIGLRAYARSIRTTRTVLACCNSLFATIAFAGCGAFQPGTANSTTRESGRCGRQVWSKAS